MSKRKKGRKETNKTIKRIFLVTEVILCLIPFMTLFYLSVGQNEYGLSYQEMLNANPILAVTFLSAMCQPFAAWLLIIAQRRIESFDYSNALVTILLVLIAECMLKNWIGIIATAILFWLTTRIMPLSIKEEFSSSADYKSILIDASGSLVLILLSALCLFASLRIGA